MSQTTVHLPDEACTLALNSALLSHHARAAIERARQNPDVLRIRDVSCTEDDAETSRGSSRRSPTPARSSDSPGSSCARRRRTPLAIPSHDVGRS